jgi:hypothetical protein
VRIVSLKMANERISLILEMAADGLAARYHPVDL